MSGILDPRIPPFRSSGFHLFFFPFLFFFSVFYFWPTSGNLPCVKICFPQYFGKTRRCMQKKYFFKVMFIFFLLTKNRFLSVFFRLFTAWSRPPGPPAEPWSILLTLCCRHFPSYSTFYKSQILLTYARMATGLENCPQM